MLLLASMRPSSAKIEEKQFETIKQQEAAYMLAASLGRWCYQKAIAAIEVVRKATPLIDLYP